MWKTALILVCGAVFAMCVNAGVEESGQGSAVRLDDCEVVRGERAGDFVAPGPQGNVDANGTRLPEEEDPNEKWMNAIFIDHHLGDFRGNPPADNQWMNALFVDGHVEATVPDQAKTWTIYR